MSRSPLSHDDLAASLAARRELGPDYDAAFADAIAERVEQSLAVRRPRAAETEKGERTVVVTVACVSLGVSIPVSAIAAAETGLAGLLIVWVAIALINVAFALRPRLR